MSDEELVAEVRQTSLTSVRQAHLGVLFERYYARVGLWCYRVTGNRDAAGDLVQEIFTKAYTKVDGFRGDAKFSTWLYSLTLNHCRDNLDKRAVRREHLMDPLNEHVGGADRFDLKLEHDQQARQARELICKSLNEQEQKILYLHYGEEMTLDAITRLLGLDNPSGAKAFIVSARRKLAVAVTRFRGRGRSGKP
ncbi:MAG TPA: sigma-70 family RNA polymerase sigma factor [Bryobacteraceae bacterium]